MNKIEQYMEKANCIKKKHLQFNALRQSLSEHFLKINDLRQQSSLDYQLHDCLMSGFAMIFFQDTSILEFQRRLEEKSQFSNLSSVFHVKSVPKDSQMRDILDCVDSQYLFPIFSDWLNRLQRGKHLAQYRFLNQYYLVPIDGSQYFSSTKIHCPGCLHKTSKKNTRYYHQILQAVIVHPDMRQVLPLAPEPIQNTDGTKKQDCEINAGKRLVDSIRKQHPKLPIIITGDDLYSKQPFIDAVKQARMSYILVAKPTDHKELFQWVGGLDAPGGGGSLEFTDKKGRIHRYQWVNQVPLNGSKNEDFLKYTVHTLMGIQQLKGIDFQKTPEYYSDFISELAVQNNDGT